MKVTYSFIWTILLLKLYEPDLSAQKILNAFPLTTALQIDGKFDTEAWSGADSASAFIQMEPKPGELSTEPTSAWFGYDDNNIYAVIKCYQRTPLEIAADIINSNMIVIDIVLPGKSHKPGTMRPEITWCIHITLIITDEQPG